MIPGSPNSPALVDRGASARRWGVVVSGNKRRATALAKRHLPHLPLELKALPKTPLVTVHCSTYMPQGNGNDRPPRHIVPGTVCQGLGIASRCVCDFCLSSMRSIFAKYSSSKSSSSNLHSIVSPDDYGTPTTVFASSSVPIPTFSSIFLSSLVLTYPGGGFGLCTCYE